MKPFSYQISIYAIADNTGIVLYVGQSCHPEKRFYRQKQLRGPILYGSSLIILRTTDEANAIRIEGQIIRAYRKRGQCQLNQRLNSSGITHRSGNPVEHNGVMFPSWAALARHLGCSVQTAKSHGDIPGYKNAYWGKTNDPFAVTLNRAATK